MAAFARPTRIVRGKSVSADWAVDGSRFEMEEERAMWDAYSGIVSEIGTGMGIRDFLQVLQHGWHLCGRMPSVRAVVQRCDMHGAGVVL